MPTVPRLVTQSISDLPDIGEVLLRTADDDDCLNEIRSVLTKHNALKRFGVVLMHRHFQMAEDEVLVEECDTATRTLTIQPKKLSDLRSAKIIETNWRLDTDQAMAACTTVCSENDAGDHTGSTHL